jgi:hypothetical protein
MAQGELLSDHPSQRQPVHVRAAHAGVVEDRDGVVGEVGDRVRQRRPVAVADAAMIEAEDPEAARQHRHRPPPSLSRGAEAHDEQDHRPSAAGLPCEPDAGASCVHDHVTAGWRPARAPTVRPRTGAAVFSERSRA